MDLEARHTEPNDTNEIQSIHAVSFTPVTEIESHVAQDAKSADNATTETIEPVASQELGLCEYPPQRDMVLSRVPGRNWPFNPMELMPFEARRKEYPPKAGFRWVIWNRGKEEVVASLYAESKMWLLDMHRQSKVEAEVQEAGGWGMLVAGALRDWDLCVEVDEEEERQEWFGVGEPYEMWDSVVPPPEPNGHYPGKGSVKSLVWL